MRRSTSEHVLHVYNGTGVAARHPFWPDGGEWLEFADDRKDVRNPPEYPGSEDGLTPDLKPGEHRTRQLNAKRGQVPVSLSPSEAPASLGNLQAIWPS